MTNTKLEQLTETLQKIGWDVRGRFPNRWIYNHKNEVTHLRVTHDRVEFEGRMIFGEKASESGSAGSINFYFEGMDIKLIDNTCVSIGNEKLFINLYNHDE